MRTLVTGAAGFIEATQAQRLLDRVDEAVGVDNPNDYYDARLKLVRLERLREYRDFLFLTLDIAERSPMSELFITGKFGAVANFADQVGLRYSVEYPHAYVDANIVGLMNVFEGRRHSRIKHPVFASGSSVYGAYTRLPFSEHDNGSLSCVGLRSQLRGQ